MHRRHGSVHMSATRMPSVGETSAGAKENYLPDCSYWNTSLQIPMVWINILLPCFCNVFIFFPVRWLIVQKHIFSVPSGWLLKLQLCFCTRKQNLNWFAFANVMWMCNSNVELILCALKAHAWNVFGQTLLYNTCPYDDVQILWWC